MLSIIKLNIVTHFKPNIFTCLRDVFSCFQLASLFFKVQAFILSLFCFKNKYRNMLKEAVVTRVLMTFVLSMIVEHITFICFSYTKLQ
jgi:hypothetical protein